MRPRSAVLAFCAAILAQVHAKIQFTNSDYHVVPGEPFELTWGGGDGSVCEGVQETRISTPLCIKNIVNLHDR